MIKYYKNDKNDLFVNPIIKNHKNLIEISKKDFDVLLIEKNSITEYEKKEIFNNDIYLKISKIEVEQIRPLRELLLNKDDIFAKEKLVKTDLEITELRNKLKK